MSSSTLADFEVLQRLGKGSYGTVFKVRRKVDDRIYVLKQICIGGLSLKEQRDCVVEVRLLASIDSPFVVRYFDSFLDGEHSASTLNIIMEFCEKGDLQQRLKRQHNELLPESTIWRYFIQTALGLHHLHSKHILHRDIKTANLMLTDDDCIRIGDLGVAKLLSESQGSFAQTTVGTPYYLSPELCEGRPYNAKSDVWALGVTLFELCTLRHPFDAANQGALILKIIRGRYPPLPAVYAATKLQRVLDALLRKDTALRPTITQVLASASVYSKARALGIAMPPDVEALVESRKQAPPPQIRPAGGRTQPLEGAHVVASPPAPELPPPARGALARTARKTRVRMGASTVGSGAAALPVICGAAPARPTPHGRAAPVLPGRGKAAAAAAGGKKTRALGAGAGSGGVQSVRDLPDVVPGALLAAGPPLHTHQPGSFIPSPEPDSSDSLSFPGAHAASAAMGHVPSAAAAAKPSVSAFKHALGSAPLAHEFGVSPLSSSRSTASSSSLAANSSGSSTAAMASSRGHGSSAAATPRDDEHDEDDGVDSESYEDDAHEDSGSIFPSTGPGDLSEDDYIAATLAQLELDEHGTDMEADLVDTSHDGDEDAVLSGSADEVQWRIIEGGAHDDDAYDGGQGDGSEHADEEPQLYDDDDETSAFAVEENKQPDSTSNPSPQPRAHAAALDASQPFGLSPHPDESHAHNSTAQFASAIGLGHGHGHGHSHPHPDASQVFHAVQERAHKLRAQIAALVAQVEEMVGRVSFAKLYEYFKVQAASDNSGGGSGGGAVASSPSPVSPTAEHEFVLSLVRVEDMDACITKLYQILYLEEEADKCAHILQLAAAAAAKTDGRAPAALATSHALNMTPRPAVPSTPSALLSTSNLTLKRQALLHPRSRAATAAAAVPNSTAAAAVHNKQQRAQPINNALPPSGNHPPLSHTLASAPGRPVPVRQRRPGGSGAGARVV